MSIFYKLKSEKFNFFYFSIPLIISGLLIVNASRNNGGIPVLNILNKSNSVIKDQKKATNKKVESKSKDTSSKSSEEKQIIKKSVTKKTDSKPVKKTSTTKKDDTVKSTATKTSTKKK